MSLYQPVHVVGGSFVHAVSIAGLVTLVPAASNVRGMILRHFAAYAAGGAGAHAVYLDAVAPAAVNDVLRRMVYGLNTGALGVPQQLPVPLDVPAGVGLFMYGGGGGFYVSVGYDLK